MQSQISWFYLLFFICLLSLSLSLPLHAIVLRVCTICLQRRIKEKCFLPVCAVHMDVRRKSFGNCVDERFVADDASSSIKVKCGTASYYKVDLIVFFSFFSFLFLRFDSAMVVVFCFTRKEMMDNTQAQHRRRKCDEKKKIKIMRESTLLFQSNDFLWILFISSGSFSFFWCLCVCVCTGSVFHR